MEATRLDVIQVNELDKSINALYDHAGAASGLPDATFDILYTLVLYGDGCSQRELCDRCWIGKQTIHSAIGRLVKRGLLSIEPGRGRATRVVLTPEGRALAEAKVSPIVEAEMRALSEFSQAEREQAHHLLARYHDALAREFAAIGEAQGEGAAREFAVIGEAQGEGAACK